jgi:protein-disulfide isomerase
MGDITVVEFMDYRCGYCRRAHPEVEDLVSADGNIRLILKEFPILGEQSEMASRFAIAAQQLHGPDVYKDVHDALIALEADVDESSLSRLAEALALDPAPLLERMASEEVTAVIESNYALAQTLGISGTPTFIMGEELVRGYVDLPGMQRIVEQARGG